MHSVLRKDAVVAAREFNSGAAILRGCPHGRHCLKGHSAVPQVRSPQYARRSTRRRTPRSAGTAVEYFVVFTDLK